MKTLVAVAAREIAERRLVLAAALVLGLVPLALPPHFPSYEPAVVRGGAMLIVLCTFLPGLALLLGGSVVARDLIERRLGFYFARPIPALAIVGGKFGGALVLLVAATLLILLPALAVGFDTGGHEDSRPWAALILAGAVLLLLGLGHAGGLAMRSRSPWLFLDVLAAPAAGFGVFAVWRRFAGVENDLVRPGMAAVLVVGFAALVTAIALSFVRGRTDLARTHKVLSLVTWGPTLAAVAGLAATAAWALSATPADLRGADGMTAAPRGGWVFVHGLARHTVPRFLFEPATGRARWIRAAAQVAFSADGTTAAWIEVQGRPGRAQGELRSVRLDEPAAVVQNPYLSVDPWSDLVLSEDGRWLAASSGETVSVVEVQSGRTLAAVNLPAREAGDTSRRLRLHFLPGGLVRIWGHGEIRELDAVAKRSEAVGRIEDGLRIERLSRDGSRALARSTAAGPQRVVLLDGRTGERIATLVDSAAPSGRGLPGEFLTDGSMVVLWDEALHRFAPDGSAGQTIPIPGAGPGARAILGGEVATGKLSVGLWLHSGSPANRLLVLDVATGRVEHEEPGLVPWHQMMARVLRGTVPQPEPGSLGARLFTGPGNSLVLLDPATGSRRELVRGGDEEEGAWRRGRM